MCWKFGVSAFPDTSLVTLNTLYVSLSSGEKPVSNILKQYVVLCLPQESHQSDRPAVSSPGHPPPAVLHQPKRQRKTRRGLHDCKRLHKVLAGTPDFKTIRVLTTF
ncbi:hypothetical protein CDAR_369201 [Caerostris darwini]|uniref:Uncharacterized protein n=1 Tax=Caerostris darwini TaxID=1538125 RepID=A0AAV4NZJ0_9ARAC|nr:hypothetical protein CDAR_369201 [Caerostris darwini]